MSIGAHVHGAIWMGILFAVLGISADRFEWNSWITIVSFVFGFVPIFIFSHVIGDVTYGIQRWITDR